MSTFVTLDASDIDDILSGARVRGQYKRAADNFGELETPVVRVDLSEGMFKGKNPDTVKQGFYSLTRSNEAYKHIQVVQKGEEVFLINNNLR